MPSNFDVDRFGRLAPARRRQQSAVSHPRQLLCETCGYVIDGLGRAGHCPECGRPISQSLPDRRVGSPAQGSASWRAWRTTLIDSAMRPRKTFELIAANLEADRKLRRRTIGIAALLLAAPNAIMLLLVFGPGFGVALGSEGANLRWWAALAGVGLSLWVAGYVAMSLMTAMERFGTGMLARTRAWRVPPPVARAICAHATVGWLVGALLAFAFCCLCGVLTMIAGGPVLRSFTIFICWWAELGAFAIGLLLFEVLAFQGVRACRFANMPVESPSAGRAAPGSAPSA